MEAVGPNHFVELLNYKIAVYDKSGNSIAQTNMIDFFRVQDPDGTNYPTGSPMSDPRILYDSASQRWISSAIDPFGSGFAILAVSTMAQ
jgi:hypothetical protein